MEYNLLHLPDEMVSVTRPQLFSGCEMVEV
jgi:hypothetical protein